AGHRATVALVVLRRSNDAAVDATAARERHAAAVALVERVRIAGELVAAAVERASHALGGWRELERELDVRIGIERGLHRTGSEDDARELAGGDDADRHLGRDRRDLDGGDDRQLDGAAAGRRRAVAIAVQDVELEMI